MISLIPISDANPTRRFPIVTVTLIVLNVLVFFQQPGFGSGSQGTVYFVENAATPCQLEADCPRGIGLTARGVVGCDPAMPNCIPIPERTFLGFLLASLVSTFFHAGFFHIIGNMLFLWVFGNNVEDFLGHVKYVAFYLLGGIAAAFAHTLTHLNSIVPAVGASGAVAAVMGAYLVLYPHARVNVLVPIFVFWTVIQMAAFAVLGLWFVYQFLIGAQDLAGEGGVAWMAHVGGFVYGAVMILLLGGRPRRREPVWPGWR